VELFRGTRVERSTNLFTKTRWSKLMSNTTTMSNAARDAVKDTKDAFKDAGKAASTGAKDVQEDLDALRADVTRLTSQFTDFLASTGNVAWEKASGVLSEKGGEAVDAVTEVRDNLMGAVDESLKNRPYTTLVLALGLGFLFGATWRR
jgi:ElaB/YqjD/DUF883 family membrane-anchored ribosome-binding protein